jgi:hypothetical protein
MNTFNTIQKMAAKVDSMGWELVTMYMSATRKEAILVCKRERCPNPEYQYSTNRAYIAEDGQCHLISGCYDLSHSGALENARERALESGFEIFNS